MNISFSEFKKRFNDYALSTQKRLKFEPSNYELKIVHTYKVVEIALKILESINADNELRNITLLGALFHDIGRFEQYIQFGTFNDTISLDHGDLGKSVLIENKLLSGLPELNIQQICEIVGYHNKYILPPIQDKRLSEALTIVRDADKIDIFRVVSEEYEREEDNDVVMLGLSDEFGVSDKVFDIVIDKKAVKYSELITKDDFKALQLGWVHDLHYDKSKLIVKENDYHTKIYNYMSKSEKSRAIYESVCDCL